MFSETKQVSGDEKQLDWGETLLQSGAAEQPKPQPTRRPLNCPRCGSTNTKFCYFNNHNESQPRHFCKSCKRHWTRGGTLRNVPVGGGRRGNKPLKTSKAAAAATLTTTTSEPEQPRFQNLLSISTDHTNMPSIPRRALITTRSSSPSLPDATDGIGNPFFANEGRVMINSTALNTPSAPQNPNSIGLPFSSFSPSFAVMNTCMITSNDYIHHYTENLDSAEEPTITARDFPTSSSAPRPVPDASSTSGMDLSDHWNWSWN